jgi:hypothetical protein
MKLIKTRSGRRRDAASMIFLAMGTIAVVAIGLAAYLSLVQGRAVMASRSQSWNLCVPAGEAGLEEAMAHLNQTRGVGLSSNGWTLIAASGVYSKQHTLAQGYYVATISTSSPPVVESIGYMKAPGGTNHYVSRRFRLTTIAASGTRGIIAKNKVTVQNSAYADSYDSTNPLYSTNGAYIATKAKQNGFVGSMSTSTSDMLVKDSAMVVGFVGTVTSNVLSMSSPARVGDLAFVSSSANDGKVQSGHHVTGLNVPFPTETAPSGAFFGIPGAGTVGGTNYNVVFDNASYSTSTFTLDSAKAVVIGNCVLYVTDTFYAKGTAVLYITPGSKLDLYVGSQFYAQDSAQVNAGGKPTQFTYHGLSGNAQGYFQGNSRVAGTFSAPNTKVYLQDTAEFSGAGLCEELVFQGSSKFHYDESLNGGGAMAYQIASWSEL